MTFNVHGLLHLANSGRSLGPLWAHSAFVFEGGNGNTVRQVSAAKGIPQQVTERIVMFQQLCQLCDIANSVNANSVTLQEQQVCKELIGYTPVQNAARVGEKLCLLGRGKVTALSCDEQRTIQLRCGIAASSALRYERFILDGQVFHSTAYTRPARSDTSFLRTASGDYKRVEKVLALRGTRYLCNFVSSGYYCRCTCWCACHASAHQRVFSFTLCSAGYCATRGGSGLLSVYRFPCRRKYVYL
ncbi:hypothetical protein HPB48_020081 [Haemaphysalis longicornis]|uniref:Uncharacterized protein n=1 Tax=Haemaphysalis longicornis TaxID=44386 RepID=A0A9J6F6J0_HAELO|nr:hypothetical protein HPB48_020081 [Haemaphysalis longicornis]